MQARGPEERSGGKAPSLVQRMVLAPFQEFLRLDAIGGIVLLCCTAFALLWANSPWRESYVHLWETPFTVGTAHKALTLSLHHWINDGLMALFFLLVGLEIKRELLVGELASARRAALPILAAVGGMAVPAAAFTLFNAGGPGARGWGIPMATDIAFALGVLTLLGPRVPVGLKVFLAALAIVDDLGAVLVIAIFYTASIDLSALLLAAVAFTLLLLLNRARCIRLMPYLAVGFLLWLFILGSGIHSTIAGVLLALTIPSKTRSNALEFSHRARRLLDDFDRAETGDLLVITSRGQQDALHALDREASAVNAPLLRLEHDLHAVVAFGIMPLFALSNAGVWLGNTGNALRDSVVWGIAAGLIAGKFAGITLFSWLAVRFRLASLPAGVTWQHLSGAGLIAGIGFTMSLFIAGLAFPDGGALEHAKIGVLLASTAAGLAGFTVLRHAIRGGTAGSAAAAGELAPER